VPLTPLLAVLELDPEAETVAAPYLHPVARGPREDGLLLPLGAALAPLPFRAHFPNAVASARQMDHAIGEEPPYESQTWCILCPQ
jgi:hypothetical protein